MQSTRSNPIPRDTDFQFIPLHLPKSGLDLISGRQYVIDPVARAVIVNEFGIQTPQIVECLHSQQDEKNVVITSTNIRTGEVKIVSFVEPAREATFRAFYKYKKTDVFTLDLAKVESLRSFYVDAPVAHDDKECSTRQNKGDSVKTKKKVVFDAALLSLLQV